MNPYRPYMENRQQKQSVSVMSQTQSICKNPAMQPAAG